MSTFVLVHGGWHGGWCWKYVTPTLRAAGHEVYTPTLTGLGERVHLSRPEVDLTTHVRDVVNVLEYEDLRDVVLVGHSYGGMVITGVADVVPDRLAQLVYLDAFVPADGQSLVGMLPPERQAGFRQMVDDTGDGWRLTGPAPFPWEAIVRESYGVTDEADVRWMVDRLADQPFATMTQPVSASNPAARSLPRTFIHCTGWHAFDRYAEHARQSGWRVHELPTGHDAMVTMPHELAALLLKLA